MLEVLESSASMQGVVRMRSDLHTTLPAGKLYVDNQLDQW